MKRSPELKPVWWDALVVLAVLLLALLLGARPVLQAQQAGALTVIVSVDGAEAERTPPSANAGGRHEHRAYPLTAAGENGAVRVAHSDCPNQDCVRSGAISRAGQSIVCLPARISVTLSGAADGYDLIAG